MSHDQSLTKPLRVRIVGVGGAGCHTIEHISRTDLGSMPVALVHTHARILRDHSCPNKLLIGMNRTHGLGSGGDADLARVMAEEAGVDLMEMVHDTDLLFIVAGLGGRHRHRRHPGHRKSRETIRGAGDCDRDEPIRL